MPNYLGCNNNNTCPKDPIPYVGEAFHFLFSCYFCIEFVIIR